MLLLFKTQQYKYILKDEDNKYRIITSKIDVNFDTHSDLYNINFDNELFNYLKYYIPMRVIARVVYFLEQGWTVEIIDYDDFIEPDFDPIKFKRFFDLYRQYDPDYDNNHDIPIYQQEISNPLINSGTKTKMMWDKSETELIYFKNNYLYKINYVKKTYEIIEYNLKKTILQGNFNNSQINI